MLDTRAPAVAGIFYPEDPAALKAQVAELLNAARGASAPCPKALIVPHAGYVYSGPVAAAAYARLVPFADRIHRVVLLGPAHRVPVRGLALPSAPRFATPLGSVELDLTAMRALRELPQVTISDAAHAMEHSLEVHLPFLQSVLEPFRLLPLVVGDASVEAVAEVLERSWGGDETVIVISSDLSHYLPYGRAQEVDRGTARSILQVQATLQPYEACGACPINGLLMAAVRHGLQASIVDLRNSGDTAGDRDRVVGYGAFAFTGTTGGQHDEERGELLVSVARSAIGTQLGMPGQSIPERSFLREPGASFVTLMRQGELRGCIGSLEPVRSLLEDVRANACAAAFSDPRFAPLTAEEFVDTRIEISVLSPAEELRFASEAEALEQLRPGLDGLILEWSQVRGTFLPQVWQQLPRPESFLRELKRKAGLPPDFWSSAMRLSRYTVTRYEQQERS